MKRRRAPSRSHRHAIAYLAAASILTTGCITQRRERRPAEVDASNDAERAAAESEPPPEPAATPKPLPPKRAEATSKRRTTYAITCYGPADVTRNAMFLHGMRPLRGPSAAELFGKDLQRLAAATKTRIALPESVIPCKGAPWKACWSSATVAETSETWNDLLASASTCFDTSRPVTLIGFSNGGYFAAKVAMRCDGSRPERILALGSSGDVANASGPNLARCSPLTVMIGDRDGTRSDAKTFAQSLRRMRFPVRFEMFTGSHEVPWDRVRRFLARPAGAP